ncbi:rhodanese-like domain-containing protein [Ekhidna sp.]|uniref:rhodanese-like domain-containing protein n=1 Tax=Ekhidna sp. TaxID=2608089 RepID=UPI0035111CC7
MIRTIYFLFALFACSAVEQEPIEVISANKLIELQKEGTVVVDIRTQEEYDEGHIPGVLHIDFLADGFLDRMKSQDMDAPIVIHCASGGRSGKASKMLSEAGFKKIYDYSGGFSDWKSNGLDIE